MYMICQYLSNSGDQIHFTTDAYKSENADFR